MNPLLRFLSQNKSLVGLIVLIVAVSLASPDFLDVNNLLNVLRQTSINAVIAMGMTFVILTAGIDLSVGAMLGLNSVLTAMLMTTTTLGLVPTLLVVCGKCGLNAWPL